MACRVRAFQPICLQSSACCRSASYTMVSSKEPFGKSGRRGPEDEEAPHLLPYVAIFGQLEASLPGPSLTPMPLNLLPGSWASFVVEGTYGTSEPIIPDQTRCSSSRPDAILVTPCLTNPNRPRASPSHRVLRSMRGNEEIKYCEDTRPGAQLEASQQQRSELCKQLQGAQITLHSILLGVGGTMYTTHTLDQFEKLGINPQRSTKLAPKLHAHSAFSGGKQLLFKHWENGCIECTQLAASVPHLMHACILNEAAP
eukprot:1156693-Pelagomonas_calceolata.AAC.6